MGNTRGCAYATENQFATKADCKRMCPEQIDMEITLIPTSEVLCDFLAKVKQPITEEMKRKFQLCHTIHQSKKEQKSRQKTMSTLCGEKVYLERQSHGFLLNG